MTRELAAALMLALLVLLLVLIWRGWQRRVGRYRHLPDLTEAASLGASPELQFSLLYVATTEAQTPLERIAKRPLAFRSKVTLGTGPLGLWLTIPGESPVVIEADRLRGVGRATWTIDRVVDSDGLIVVAWQWGDTPVESYFRSVDYPADDIVAAISAVLPQQEDV